MHCLCPYQLPYILRENAHQVIYTQTSWASNSDVIHTEIPKFFIFQLVKSMIHGAPHKKKMMKWFSSVFLLELSSELDTLIFIKNCKLQLPLTSWIMFMGFMLCVSQKEKEP